MIQNAHKFPGGQFVQVSHGWETVCAIDIKGGLQCWGNMFRDPKNQDLISRYDGDFTQVTVTEDAVCALTVRPLFHYQFTS